MRAIGWILVICVVFFNQSNAEDSQKFYTHLGSADLLNPNDEVYHQIYRESVNGQLRIERDEDQTLQQSYSELFQQRERRPGTDPTALERCASQVQIPPGDLRAISGFLPKNEFFYGINPHHLNAMHGIKHLLMNTRTAMDTICMARALRDRPEINRHAWLRGVLSATMRRDDMRTLARPQLAEIMPSLMINNPAIQQARNQTDTCSLVDGSVGVENGDENRLWYWREDIMVNSHHLYWHLSNPFSFERLQVPTSTRPDRRGELFYYMHHSLLARYHSERLSNGLPPVVPLFINPGTILREPYYAHLTDATSARNWTDRPANTLLQNLVSNRDFVNHPANISITDRLTNLGRIEEAIRTRTLRHQTGSTIPLDSYTGIDHLGEIVESSIYSVNPDFYGEFGIHNDGHFLIGLVADADDRLQLPPSVMADGATAMRDPVFYTYHQPIDRIFEQLKDVLEPYSPTGGEFPLQWPNVEIQNLQVFSNDGFTQPNELKTFWNYATVDLVRGLDFNRTNTQGPAAVCVQHLDHQPFTYQLAINRKDSSPSSQSASVRIFMAPRHDGNGNRYPMNEQRKLFFALDYFQADLKPGRNVINRKSIESTLTIPWTQAQEELERDSASRLTPYCGCGWPDHLLIPKGTQQGMVFDLFVMVTNAFEDSDSGRISTSNFSPSSRTPNCRPAPIYCGIMGERYPDTKPMGYPFDRVPYSIPQRQDFNPYFPPNQFNSQSSSRMVHNLEEYVHGIPNMIATQVIVRHIGDQRQQPFSFGQAQTQRPFSFGGY